MTSLHFAQVSDIHISDLGDHDDMVSGHTAGFLADICARLDQIDDLDFVLFSGDLLDGASGVELERFQQIARALHKPYYVIPGNHDWANSPGQKLSRRQFAGLFNPQASARPAEPAAQVGYWSVPIGPEVQLIGLDSTRDKDWGGEIDALQRAWLQGQLNACADKIVLLAVHHPFHALAPIDSHPNWGKFVCDDGAEMLALLDNYPQVKVVLTGHHHLARADWLGRRLHLACPALAGYPCAYRTLRLVQTPGQSWQLAWQTHLAADTATLSQARIRMAEAWRGAGFEPGFVEQHVNLAYGSEQDRAGQVELA